MNEQVLKCLNGKNILKEKFDELKEYFVRFYGEEERERIEEFFLKVLVIPYLLPTTIDMAYSETQKEITKDIINRYRKEISYDDLTNDLDFSIERRLPLYDFMLFYNAMNSGKSEDELESLFENVKSLLGKIDENISLSNYQEFRSNPKIRELEYLAKQYPSMLDEYKKRIAKYDKIKSLVDNYNNLKEKIESKYYRKYIESNLDLLSPEIREEVERYLASSSTTVPPIVDRIFGKLSGVTEIPDEKLVSPEAKDKIIDSRIKMLNECEIEKHANHFLYMAYKDEIDALGLYGSDNGVLEGMCEAATATIPNLRKRENEFELYSIIIILFDRNEGNIDHNIVHELNHHLEHYLLKVDDDSFTTLSGWDILTNNFYPQEEKSTKKKRSSRKYELFNEMINELIAQDICEEMAKDKFTIFDDEDNWHYKKVCSYERLLFLVEDFYKTYKDKIIKSRKNGNLEILLDEVGKDNFEDLNRLFFSFKDNLNRYISPQEIKELKLQRDEILKRMKEYSEQKNVQSSSTKKN